jgi:endoglucanase
MVAAATTEVFPMQKSQQIWAGMIVFASLMSCAKSNEKTTCQEIFVSVPYRGVNLAGAEFAVDPDGNGTLPGTFGQTYIYPDSTYVNGYNSPSYFAQKGMTVFRLPFRWERLQPARNQAFNPAELGRLTTTVANLRKTGAAVLLDPHNYARYGTALIGSQSVPNADFADLWARLATQFKNDPLVIFGLMNEPHDMPTEQWVSAANAAIAAIRTAGASNLIFVPGNAWTGAYSWTDNWYGTANGVALLNINDPANNYAFEVHQYLDANSSGGGQTCVSTTIGSQRLTGFTNWLKNNNKKGFLGEFGGGANATCNAAIDDMLKHIESNASVWLGWSYWAAGPWWGNGYPSIEPHNNQDAYQMMALIPHLQGPMVPDAGTMDASFGLDAGATTDATVPAAVTLAAAMVMMAAAAAAAVAVVAVAAAVAAVEPEAVPPAALPHPRRAATAARDPSMIFESEREAEPVYFEFIEMVAMFGPRSVLSLPLG